MFALATGCPSDDGPAATTEDTGSGTAGSGSSGAPACADPETQGVFTDAAEAVLEGPMALGPADMLMRDVARSHIAEEGTVTVSFTTTCGGPVYLWALVWDIDGGPDPENADSLYVSVDGGEESAWLYGCGTDDAIDSRWWWLPIDAWTEADCDHTPLMLDLPAGAHTVTLRNREAGVDIDVAAIAAVLLSHDPGADPNEFFAPPG